MSELILPAGTDPNAASAPDPAQPQPPAAPPVPPIQVQVQVPPQYIPPPGPAPPYWQGGAPPPGGYPAPPYWQGAAPPPGGYPAPSIHWQASGQIPQPQQPYPPQGVPAQPPPQQPYPPQGVPVQPPPQQPYPQQPYPSPYPPQDGVTFVPTPPLQPQPPAPPGIVPAPATPPLFVFAGHPIRVTSQQLLWGLIIVVGLIWAANHYGLLDPFKPGPLPGPGPNPVSNFVAVGKALRGDFAGAAAEAFQVGEERIRTDAKVGDAKAATIAAFTKAADAVFATRAGPGLDAIVDPKSTDATPSQRSAYAEALRAIREGLKTPIR